jgi:threonine dehydrogenase-like Zn-dependent dehydrogenase
MSNFFDKVKQSASDAADAVKDKTQEAKIKNEIVRTYEELGRKTFELVEAGKIKSTAIRPHVKHLKELKAQLDKLDQPDYVK